jgi:hypothetical protein
MRKQELLEQVDRFLERKLSPEECKFLLLASSALKVKKKPLARAPAANSKVA